MSYERPSESDDQFGALERVLQRDGHLLEPLAVVDGPLTIDTLELINPDLVPTAEHISRSVLQWPDHDTALWPSDSQARNFGGPDADRAFAFRLWQDSYGAANFQTLLSVERRAPTPKLYQELIVSNYIQLVGTKPYLLRAYGIAPDFMAATRKATLAAGDRWSDMLMSAAISDDEQSADRLLLRSSRLAYGLMARLMRRDDLIRLDELLGVTHDPESAIDVPAPLITDPDRELIT